MILGVLRQGKNRMALNQIRSALRPAVLGTASRVNLAPAGAGPRDVSRGWHSACGGGHASISTATGAADPNTAITQASNNVGSQLGADTTSPGSMLQTDAGRFNPASISQYLPGKWWQQEQPALAQAAATSQQPLSESDGMAGVHDAAESLQHMQSSSTALPSFLSDLAAASAAENTVKITIFRDAADALQWVHDTTGLEWWAAIPLTSLCLRLALLPISLFQAKTVRTNFLVYKESVMLTDKQLGLSSSTLPGIGGKGPDSAHPELTAAEKVKRGKLILANFGLLRSKLGAPHPIWILINPMVQVPVFAVTSMTLRMMGKSGWPGFKEEGALWFPDLTQVALIPGADLTLPMGLHGFILPAVIFTMTITSLRMGLGAAVAKNSAGSLPVASDEWVGKFLRVLPPLLYGLTVMNLWVKVQLPHASLLHWTATAAFTLSLQLALRRPEFREAFRLPSPRELQESLARLTNQRLLEISESGGALAPNSRGYTASKMPQALVKKVAEEKSADVLVVLGAQHSAQKRYREALYCLDKALQLEPAHVRAHYSRGQVFSLANRWPDAEASFRRAAELAANDAERGQATYCIATALHTQGKLEAAVEAYRQAIDMWAVQRVVVWFSLSNALVELGRLQEAAEVVAEALGSEQMAGPRAPFKQHLLNIQEDIKQRQKKLEEGSELVTDNGKQL